MSSKSDLNLPITAEDFTRSATDTAGRNFDRLQGKVNAFKTDKAQKEADEFGRLVTANLKDGETAFAGIQREVDKTKIKTRELRSEFATSGRASVFGDLKSTEHDLARLEQFLTDMGGDAGDAGAKNFATSFSEALSSSEANPAVLAIAAALVVPLAAAAGAAVATALEAGLGFGFIAAGAFALRQNKVLAGKIGQLKGDISSELADAAAPLIEPFDRALTRIDALIASEKPAISAIFDAVAPAVDEIELIIENLVRQVVPALAPIAKNFTEAFADPQVAAAIRELEAQIGFFFREIGNSKTVVVDTFRTILVALNFVIATVNILIAAANALDTIWHATGIPLLVGKITGATARNTEALHANAAAARDDTTAVTAGATAVAAAVPTWDALTATLSATVATGDNFARTASDKILGSLLASDHATLGWHESLTALRKAMKENKRALDIHSAAGQADRESILSVVAANIQQYDSMIASGISAEDAAKKYDKNTKALRRQLTDLGIAPKKVDELVGAYDKVPDAVNTTIVFGDLEKTLKGINALLQKYGFIPPDVSTVFTTPGLAQANDDVSGLHRLISALPKHTDLTFSAHIGASVGKAISQLSHADFSLGDGWMPGAPTGTATAPPRDVSVTSHLTASFILDGQVIDRRVHRVTSKQRHAQKVGRR